MKLIVQQFYSVAIQHCLNTQNWPFTQCILYISHNGFKEKMSSHLQSHNDKNELMLSKTNSHNKQTLKLKCDSISDDDDIKEHVV